MRVKVYRNLLKAGVQYSVSYRGKVRHYTRAITLKNVVMKHPTAKQLKEVREGHRQVCAWVTGEPTRNYSLGAKFRRLASDPKRVDFFCDNETGERVDAARIVVLDRDGGFYAK